LNKTGQDAKKDVKIKAEINPEIMPRIFIFFSSDQAAIPGKTDFRLSALTWLDAKVSGIV